jgi:hypothetical protein
VIDLILEHQQRHLPGWIRSTVHRKTTR